MSWERKAEDPHLPSCCTWVPWSLQAQRERIVRAVGGQWEALPHSPSPFLRKWSMLLHNILPPPPRHHIPDTLYSSSFYTNQPYWPHQVQVEAGHPGEKRCSGDSRPTARCWGRSRTLCLGGSCWPGAHPTPWRLSWTCWGQFWLCPGVPVIVEVPASTSMVRRWTNSFSSPGVKTGKILGKLGQVDLFSGGLLRARAPEFSLWSQKTSGRCWWNQEGHCGPSWADPLPLSSTCLLLAENFNFLGLPWVLKSKFNWRGETMQKQSKTFKQDKIIIVKP